MDSANKIWAVAQEEEYRCWKMIEPEMRNEIYWDLKRKFWRLVFEKLDITELISSIPAVSGRKKIVILDLGCGPSGALIELPFYICSIVRERCEYIGLDPLMDKYLEISTKLRKLPVRWVKGCAERLGDYVNKVHLLLSFNAIDHTYDIQRVIRQICNNLSQGGIAIVSSNCHTSRLTAYLMVSSEASFVSFY